MGDGVLLIWGITQLERVCSAGAFNAVTRETFQAFKEDIQR